jgi:hypothetical protein
MWLSRSAAPLAGGLFGAAFFVWIVGLMMITPTQVEWVMKLDWRIHFLGWHRFRGEPWHWPPGRLDSYYHAPTAEKSTTSESARPRRLTRNGRMRRSWNEEAIRSSSGFGHAGRRRLHSPERRGVPGHRGVAGIGLFGGAMRVDTAAFSRQSFRRA